MGNNDKGNLRKLGSEKKTLWMNEGMLKDADVDITDNGRLLMLPSRSVVS
jgi:hypothetical protein